MISPCLKRKRLPALSATISSHPCVERAGSRSRGDAWPLKTREDRMTDRVDPGRFEGRTTDPGSWEVRIDTLLTAITITSQTVTGFIRLVRSARNDLVQVSRELSDLRLELELLRGERDVPRQIQTCGRPLLDSCGAVLRRISSLLGGPSPSSPPPRPDRAADASRPARWSVKERFQTSNLCNCVQIHREALALLHELANLYVLTHPFCRLFAPPSALPLLPSAFVPIPPHPTKDPYLAVAFPALYPCDPVQVNYFNGQRPTANDQPAPSGTC